MLKFFELIISGSLNPFKGTVTVNGLDIRTSIDIIRQSIGYCPQFNVLFDELTVEEHITFFAYLKVWVKSYFDRILVPVLRLAITWFSLHIWLFILY